MPSILLFVLFIIAFDILKSISMLIRDFFCLKVDLDDMDEKKFPKVQDLEFVDCILEEGEMLYIPPKWWHYVRSLTTSFSVSFWWSEGESSDAS